jgi:hypothetical protein
MKGIRVVTTIATLSLMSLAGCIGPRAVSHERLGFNDAVAATGRAQLLLNIVRASKNEQPQFVDVSQVTNTSQLNESFTASFGIPQAVGGGEHTGHDYSPGFTVGGYDQPAITYTPLLGAPLVAQLAQPINVDSIVALYDSGWPLGPLLTFVARSIGPDPNLETIVIDDLQHLAAYNVLVLVPAKSQATSGPGGDDSIQLFCNPDGAVQEDRPDAYCRWNRLKTIFGKTYVNLRDIGVLPPTVPGGPKFPHSPSDYFIELRTVPTSQPTMLPEDQVIPLLRTRSALGALMTAANETATSLAGSYRVGAISFVDGESKPDFQPVGDIYYEVQISPQHAAVAHECTTMDSVTTSSTRPIPADLSALMELREQAQSFPSVMAFNGRIIRSRRKDFVDTYIVVHRGKDGPKLDQQPYVLISFNEDGLKYWISSDDQISQRNFEIMSLLLTIQAQSSATPPPIPAISVGGH